MDFEVCIDSVEGAKIAAKYGAKRVELCAALSEGGLTPSLAMVKACVDIADIEVFVMIRPRAGGFNYSEAELEIMEQDIRAAHNVGAQGVVFGVLTDSLSVDVKKNLFLVETALKLKLGTTFHRAIDVCADPLNEIAHLVNLGFDRVLSSGGKPRAVDGIELLQDFKTRTNEKLQVMAGSGVNPNNTQRFITAGLNAVHFTAHQLINNELALDMGPQYKVDEEKIRAISQICR